MPRQYHPFRLTNPGLDSYLDQKDKGKGRMVMGGLTGKKNFAHFAWIKVSASATGNSD